MRSKIRVSYLYTSIFSNFGLGTLCHRKRLADFGLISDDSDAHARLWLPASKRHLYPYRCRFDAAIAVFTLVRQPGPSTPESPDLRAKIQPTGAISRLGSSDILITFLYSTEASSTLPCLTSASARCSKANT